MKRFYTASIGLAIALLPQITNAQCPESDVAKALLEKEPVGHYTKVVIERVNEGILGAKAQQGGSTIFDALNMHWLVAIESIMYMLMDTDIQSVEYSRDLTKITACLHADLAILEAKIEEVRCELKEAHLNKSPGAINRLQSVSLFLKQRYKHLLRGSTNTEYVDPYWQYWHAFDEPYTGWCCVRESETCEVMTADKCTGTRPDGTGSDEFYPTRDMCLDNGNCLYAEDATPQPKYDPICPFDSNYLAPTFSGYGCDLSVLAAFSDLDDSSHQAEYEALEEFLGVRDEFLEDTEHIKDATIKMDEILENTMLSDDERQHLEQFGEVKVSEIEHKHIFNCNADVPAEGDEDEDGDSDPADKVKPSTLWAAHELRGPFFFIKDHLSLWKEFFKINIFWAEQREFPQYLKKPSEFYDEADREQAMGLQLFIVPRNYLRSRWSKFMIEQAGQEAAILPKAQDMQSGVIEAMESLRPAMKKNIELVQESAGGMRKFAKGFAYFLRRSCINRQCNSQLETILKILFSDECFPYASGDFDPSDENSSGDTWKKCKEAVENL